MRRFLLCSGLDSRSEGLEWLRYGVELYQPEGVLFAGGVLHSNRQYTPRCGTTWGMTRDDSMFVEHFFETLGELAVFAAVIPGPSDTPIGDFLRMGMHAEVEFPNIHLVHGTLATEGDVAIAGMGGVICDGPAWEKDFCSRTIAEYHLRTLWTATQPHRILLLPTAPTGPLGGPEGATLISEMIDSYHPTLCVVAGPTSRRGSQRIAHTLVVNPGHLADGWAGLFDWNQRIGKQVELMDLQSLDHAVAEIGAGI
jgi:hypothetical protein